MAFVRTGRRGDATWALVLEAWDAPPSWFDVPEVDQQPAIAERALRRFEAVAALGDGVSAEVALGEALDEAGEALRVLGHELPGVIAGGTGAFVAALMARGETLAVAWAGCARVFRLRGGHLELLSHDHVLGAQAPSEALRHVVTRHLATEDGAEVAAVEVRAGDRFILVSAEGAELLATHRAQAAAGTPGEAVSALLDAWPGALASAGVVVADVVDG